MSGYDERSEEAHPGRCNSRWACTWWEPVIRTSQLGAKRHGRVRLGRVWIPGNDVKMSFCHQPGIMGIFLSRGWVTCALFLEPQIWHWCPGQDGEKRDNRQGEQLGGGCGESGGQWWLLARVRGIRTIQSLYKARLHRTQKATRLFRVRARKGAEMVGGLEPTCLGDWVDPGRFKKPGSLCQSGSNSPRTDGRSQAQETVFSVDF